jgi:hypothetical protein
VMMPLPVFSTTRSATTSAPRIASRNNNTAMGHLPRRRVLGQGRRDPESSTKAKGEIRVGQR